ncbi:hypothetical protein V6N13_048935 [Hibiscus sabdariffa]
MPDGTASFLPLFSEVGNLALYAEKLRDFCAMPFEVCICHIPRTQNVVVDRVVALCRGSSVVSMTFDSVSVALAELVRKEAVAG